MSFIHPDLESILPVLDKLSAETQAKWGTMSAQRMVEHLTDVVLMSTGINPQQLLVPEEKLPRMLEFLASDKPMAQNIEVPFAKADTPLRNEELELAIDELTDSWLLFEEYYEENPDATVIHAYYGPLNYEGWQRLHSKHFTHHFTQFGLLGE